ncbi:MAG: hypothetical protein HY904_14730 [Deltaproteobacteria bacterium]|nr:hypothetical protein [Deltaproteobacteria bacterium]
MRFNSALGAWTGLVLAAGPVAAQYRNNGLFAEVGAESHEVAPLTVATVAGSELGLRGWKAAYRERVLPAGPGARQGCLAQVTAGDGGLPCRYDWWGLTDGPYLGVGVQRVVGDLLVDVSEAPLLRNLVLTGRTGVAPGLTLPFSRDVVRPAAAWHAETGIRWNILDEQWRPFIGLAGGMTVMLDPVAVLLRARRMDETCRRVEAGEPLGPSDVCVREDYQLPNGTSVNPSYLLFGANAAPVLVNLRPEAGLEWFFKEDLSLQASVTAAVHGTLLPAYLLHPPFFGVDGRATLAVVAYY